MAGKLLKSHTMEFLQSKFLIRLHRSVVYLIFSRATFFFALTHFLLTNYLHYLLIKLPTYNYECNFFFKVAKNVYIFVGNNNYSWKYFHAKNHISNKSDSFSWLLINGNLALHTQKCSLTIFAPNYVKSTNILLNYTAKWFHEISCFSTLLSLKKLNFFY